MPPKSSRLFVALKLATKGAPTLDNAPQRTVGTFRQDVLQLIERKGLGQMKIETGRQSPRFVGFGWIARKRHEHDVVECSFKSNCACDFEAVYFRHPHVDDCNLRVRNAPNLRHSL